MVGRYESSLTVYTDFMIRMPTAEVQSESLRAAWTEELVGGGRLSKMH